MNNHMAGVAKLLGVELEEKFKIKEAPTTSIYKISEKGLVLHHEEEDWWEAVPYMLALLLTGERKIVKLPWEPSHGDSYYMPSVVNSGKYLKLFWTGSEGDKSSYQQGLVYRTSREAIKLAEEMLDVARKRFAVAKEENNG